MAFDPLAHQAEGLEFDDLEQGGMGLSFIEQLASERAYERVDGRNVFTLTFEL